MRSTAIIVALLILTASITVFVIGERSDDDNITFDPNMNDPPTRIIQESNNVGGMWYDGLSDTLGVSSFENVKFFDGRAGLNQVVFEDDFEDYLNDENVVDSSKWSSHGTYNEIAFRGCDTPLAGAPSNNVLKAYNSDDLLHSMIISSTFDLPEGYFETWVASSQIDQTDHTITAIGLYGTTSLSPTLNDRALAVSFNHGGFTIETGSSNTIATGLSADTWYRVAISWDFSSNTADIAIYNTGGVQLGVANNVAMTNSFTSMKRVLLACGHNTNYQYITNYWDELVVADGIVDGSGVLTSVQIDKPTNGYWSSLRVDKEEPGESTLELTILDQNSAPISSSLYDSLSNDLDLSFLNDLDVTAITLVANFIPDGMLSPYLDGWGVDWNTTHGWTDSFLTDQKIGSMENLEVKDRSLVIESTDDEGIAESVKIRKPQGYYWFKLRTSQESTYPSYVLYDVIDGTSGTPIEGFTNLTGGNINLLGIDPKEHRDLKLRVRARTFGTLSLTVQRWSLEWRINSDPLIVSLDSPTTIYRNNTGLFQLTVLDNDQDPDELDIDVRYKHEIDTTYRTDMIDQLEFDGVNSTWRIELKVPISAVVGNYSFKISMEDAMGKKVEVEYSDHFRISNNIPIPPIFILAPDDPGTEDDLYVQVIEQATDVESKILFFTYKWFVNEEELVDQRLEGIWGGAEVSLSSNFFHKGDTVRCEVKVSDGENISLPSSYSIHIINSEPVETAEFSPTISIMEDIPSIWELDLSKMFKDADGDDLSFTIAGEENLTITVSSNGTLTIVPQDNWNGLEVVVVTVTDGSSVFSFDLTIDVIAVNDPPTGSFLTPVLDITIEVGHLLTFTGSADDIDSDPDEIDLSWYSNGTKIGEGSSFNHTWEEHGIYVVELWIDDGTTSVVVGNRTITVQDPLLLVDVAGYTKTYNTIQGNIMFDIIDIEGTVNDVRSHGPGEYDIMSLSSKVVGREVWVTMLLFSDPVDPLTLGPGYEASYEVYFVSENWEEPIFLSEFTEPDTPEKFIPPVSQRHRVGSYGSLGYLTYGKGDQDYGSPRIDGNSIVWKVPIEVLLNSGVEDDKFELFGYVSHSESSILRVSKCFDTAGKGSNTHFIDKQPGNTDVEEAAFPFLLGIIIAAVILFVVIILVVILVIVLVVVRKNKRQKIENDHQPITDQIEPVPIVSDQVYYQGLGQEPALEPLMGSVVQQPQPTLQEPVPAINQQQSPTSQIPLDPEYQTRVPQPQFAEISQQYPVQFDQEGQTSQGWVGPVAQGPIDPPQVNDPSVPDGYFDSTAQQIQQQPPERGQAHQVPSQHPQNEPVTPPVPNNDLSTDL